MGAGKQSRGICKSASHFEGIRLLGTIFKSNQVKLSPVHQAYAYFQIMQTITCYQLDLSDESAKIQLFHALEDLISSDQIKCYELHFPRFGPWIEEMCLGIHQ